MENDAEHRGWASSLLALAPGQECTSAACDAAYPFFCDGACGAVPSTWADLATSFVSGPQLEASGAGALCASLTYTCSEETLNEYDASGCVSPLLFGAVFREMVNLPSCPTELQTPAWATIEFCATDGCNGPPVVEKVAPDAQPRVDVA